MALAKLVQASCDSWLSVIVRRPRLVALLAAVAATALGAGLTFRRVTSPWSVLPDYDYWSNIRGIVTENGLAFDFEELFRYNNEHIVVIPKLVYAINYLLTSGSNVGLIVYSIFVGAACAFLLLVLARDLLRDMPARWAFCAVLFPLAMFSAKLSHSYYFGMSGTIWLTADLLVIVSMAALAEAAKRRSVRWLFASLLAALLGILAYSTAIYALVVLLVFCVVFLAMPTLRRRFPWPVLAGVAAIAATVITILLVDRPHPKGHPALDFDPLGLAGFVLVYLGGSISNGYWQPVMGLVILGAGALAIRLLMAEGRGSDVLLWVTLFLFAPFNALMTGIGRLGFGLKAAMSSRYQSVTVISLIATIALVLAALPKTNGSRRDTLIRTATVAALAAIAVFFIANRNSTKMYAKRLENKPVAEIALRQNIAGGQHITSATPTKNQFAKELPALRGARHVPFNTLLRCEGFLGQRIAAASSAPAGALEEMATYPVWQEERTAIELSGWAVQDGMPAECIAIVDGEGVVIGAGAPADLRLDPSTKRWLRIGWKAVASPPGAMPVCAFALFPGQNTWIPLANCQTGAGGG